ncbi:hypothetical protein [Moraxella lacunata]|uniref:hypothetical protein n=1 Tax=Moraxella lacunata TaxID=477 RepID=UPI003EE0C156
MSSDSSRITLSGTRAFSSSMLMYAIVYPYSSSSISSGIALLSSATKRATSSSFLALGLWAMPRVVN